MSYNRPRKLGLVARLGAALRGGFRASYESARITTPDQLAEAIAGLNRTASGAYVSPETAMRVGAVYGCVRILADSVAMLPLRLYRSSSEDDARIDPGHPVDRLLVNRPNRWQTPFAFKRLMMTHLLLRGNFYAYVSPNPKGQPGELLPLNPDKMEVDQQDDLSIRYSYSLKTGVKKVYREDTILHVRAMSTDGVMGLSPLDAAREAIGLSMQAEKHGAKLYTNGARPGGVLKHPNTLSNEAQDRLRDQVATLYEGSENAFRTMLLEEGMDWQQIGMTPEQTQFIESRKFQRSEIAMFFGVPPHMIGDVDKATSWGSGIEQQGVGFVVYSLQPWLVNITEAADTRLLSEPEQRRYFTKFDTTLLTLPDFKSRQEGRRIMLESGVISPNEWRREEGLNPRDGGDEYRNGSTQQDRQNDGQANQDPAS